MTLQTGITTALIAVMFHILRAVLAILFPHLRAALQHHVGIPALALQTLTVAAMFFLLYFFVVFSRLVGDRYGGALGTFSRMVSTGYALHTLLSLVALFTRPMPGGRVPYLVIQSIVLAIFIIGLFGWFFALHGRRMGETTLPHQATRAGIAGVVILAVAYLAALAGHIFRANQQVLVTPLFPLAMLFAHGLLLYFFTELWKVKERLE